MNTNQHVVYLFLSSQRASKRPSCALESPAASFECAVERRRGEPETS